MIIKLSELIKGNIEILKGQINKTARDIVF